MKKVKIYIALALIASVCCFSQQKKELIQVTDLLKIRTVGDVELSKDGQNAVFTVKSIIKNPENALDYDYDTQLWITKTAKNNAPRQLTFGKEASSSPVFSPDGKQIAFTRNVKGKSQLFLFKVDEGGEAVQLTETKYGAGNPKWSPDGKQILFTASIQINELIKDSVLNPKKELPLWSFEKPGFEANENLKPNKTKADPNGSIEAIRAYLENNEKDKKAKVVDKLHFQTETAVSSELRFTHIFIIDAKPGSKEKAVTKGFYSHSNPSFISNTKIAFNGSLNEKRHPDRVLENKIYTINTDGTALTELLGAENKVFQLLAVSPSGKQLAYQESISNNLSIPVLNIFSLENPSAKSKVIEYDRNNTNVRFSKDDRQLYFTSSSNGGHALCTVPLNTLKVETLTSFDQGITDYDFNNGVLAFAKTEVQNPSELYISDLKLKEPRLVSEFNTNWLKNKAISFPQKYTFTNEKGLEIEYWVTKPTRFEQGKKYPLLTEIHGGPASMFGPGDASMWLEYQFFAAQGYGVLYSNPRGSSGYGEKFLRSNIKDWGPGPSSDVLTALDKTTALGWADTNRLFITGGSYAGYLTTWIISHDQRFKAASAQRGVYELNTFFGEGNVWRMVPRYWGGYPWEKETKAILERESPLNYAENINIPFLIIHGDNDYRTGVTQSQMLYKMLKVLGKPVEYVRQPNASHEITRSGDNRQRIDQLLRTFEFFERFNQ
ncbi:S9 family peptidase [Flavobacterium foetidum]|uniref:S9 family peptidase n=1 Tax=Flavobacterium foetidum TaxID=2026681 RepID=UPI001074F486|nr:S9 family peptidase [Flavobacterium foetidum]KAF2507418.1 S9 family peptidase [Flavobacterium foetidum]